MTDRMRARSTWLRPAHLLALMGAVLVIILVKDESNSEMETRHIRKEIRLCQEHFRAKLIDESAAQCEDRID